ncbi:MAG: hypothetical protein GC138_08150 [Gammaproteobacteria bacterium]|nr:hypothetical protein [Gammaproteobacteria bacterium]
MLNVVVALHCEAAPLIDALGLKRVGEPAAFPVFVEHDTRLVLCGIGKRNAATATNWLHTEYGGAQGQAWLNLGTAGHGMHRLGTGVLAHRVRDAASGRSWHPSLSFATPLVTDEIITVDQVQMGYPLTGCFEMEAAGFYSVAEHFSTPDLVHCCKVITDNPRNIYTEITEELATELVAERLPEILELCETLREKAHERKR